MSRIEGDEEMAQSGFALVQLSGDLANGDAGAMDGTNGGGAVKIVKADPVGLELRDRESVVHQGWSFAAHHLSLVLGARTKTDDAQNRDQNVIRLTVAHVILLECATERLERRPLRSVCVLAAQ